MFTKLTFLLPFFIVSISTLSAQITNNLQTPTSINADGEPPDESAILDVQATDKGMLLPRMTTAERDAIIDPAPGLLIYNTVDSCFNYYSGEAWFKDCGRSLTVDSRPSTTFEGGGPGSFIETSSSVAMDQLDNLFLSGSFGGTATFGTQSLTSAGSSDVFILKFNPAGEVVWAVRGGGPNADQGIGIATDSQGNVLVTGYYVNTATFGTVTLTSSGSRDLFIAKYDTDGNLLWAKNGNSNVSSTGHDIDTDASGNVMVTGDFSGTIQLNATALTSVSVQSVFTVKMDSTGNTVWARASGGTSTNEIGTGIGTDFLGNVLVAGFYNSGDISFGTVTLSDAAGDVFLTKYDPSGNVVWAVAGGGGTGAAATTQDVTIDAAGNAIVTGNFSGTAAFGPFNLNGAGSFNDVFVVKYAPAGDVTWARAGNGSDSYSAGIGDYGIGIHADAEGNVYVAGSLDSTLTFHPFTLISSGLDDAFVVKYSPAGDVQWATSGGGWGQDIGNGLTTDILGNVIVTGNFQAPATFEPTTLTGLNDENIYVWKLSPSGGNHLLTNSLSNTGNWSNSGGHLVNTNGDGNVGIGESFPTHKLTVKSTDHGTMRLIGPDNGLLGVGAVLNFGDGDFMYISEPSDDLMRIQANAVGIGRAPTTNRLEVEGNASKTVAGNWLANSDARLKTNIRPLDSKDMLEKMLSLQGITYEWADEVTGSRRPKGTHYGFTAQNVQEVFPTLVTEDNLGFLQTAYGTYDAMTVEAVRALADRIGGLKNENDELRAEVELLKSQLQQITSVLNKAGILVEN